VIASDYLRHVATGALTKSMREMGYLLPLEAREVIAAAVLEAVVPVIRREGVAGGSKPSGKLGCCSHCGRGLSLRTDGTMRTHGTPWCPGSGLLPVGA
jgi:hypothetical protein